MPLDVATVMLQWAGGGLFFLWFTTRRREVGLGYGWLLRGTFAGLAGLGLFLGLRYDTIALREVSSAAVLVAAVASLLVSVRRRAAGVAGQQAEFDRRSERVAAMTGIERTAAPAATSDPAMSPREFPPLLDLAAAALAVPGLVAAAVDADRPIVALIRLLAGAAFLGAITDAMLLGHWYLVQPGLPRRHLNDLVRAVGITWPIEVAALLLPTGMLSVWRGTIDDGWNGMLGWMWAACAATTLILVFVTRAALRERYYSAVMAATGLLYLAVLTAFGTDLVARAVLDV
jgi:hypothetical protein